MLPIILLGIVILIAAIGSLFYYQAVTRPPSKKRPKSQGDFAKPVTTSSFQVEIKTNNRAVTTTTGKNPQESASVDFLFHPLLTPQEDGIYHHAAKLTEAGWEDLEFVLMSLSHLPSDVMELLKLLNNSKSSAASITKICQRNVGLTARILKIVNSPFYGLRVRVDDIHHAVTLLGFDEIRQIILTTSLFQNEKTGPGLIQIEDLWNHSIATARITSIFAEKSKIEIRKSLAGTCALLHDIGKLVLQRWRQESFKRALLASKEKSEPLMAIELRELGITHSLAAVLLLERWRLSPALLSTVKGCQLPVVSSDLPEAALVYLSGQAIRYMGIGDDGEAFEDEIPKDISQLLGIEAYSVSELITDEFKEFINDALLELMPAKR